jgi:hypothetical protein
MGAAIAQTYSLRPRGHRLEQKSATEILPRRNRWPASEQTSQRRLPPCAGRVRSSSPWCLTIPRSMLFRFVVDMSTVLPATEEAIALKGRGLR